MADIKLYGTLIRDDDTNTQKIVNANQVAGGFFVCASVLTSGTWQTGQLCYCTGDSKFYQYDGTEWREKEFGTNNIATSSVLGLVKSSTTGTAANRDYNVQVNSDGTMKVNVPWTDTYTNTTYTIAAGDSDGQIKVTPSDGDAYNVSVKGLGSAAYTDSSAYAEASHGTHVTYGGNGSATTVSRSDHTHAYKPTFSKTIYHGAAGNPQQIKFITVDYSTYDSGSAAYFKLDATSCHGNGVSYQFLEEILIGVTASGDVSLV